MTLLLARPIPARTAGPAARRYNAGMCARILLVAPDLPHPPFTGAHTRPLSILAALSRDHEVIVCGAASPQADLSALHALCAGVERSPVDPYAHGPAHTLLSRARRELTPVPLLSRSHSAALAELVSAAVTRYRPDAVQIEGMYAAHYRPDRVPAVLDLPDVTSGLCEAAAGAHRVRYWAAGLQQRAAERAERKTLPLFRAVLTINDDDAARLRRLGLDPTTVPLAVGLPQEAEATKAGRPPQGRRRFRILFVGNFPHQPNRAAADFIARRLVPRLEVSGVRCEITVAGRGAGELRGFSLARQARGCVGLTYAADPPDLSGYYDAADVVLVPLAYGGGTKNKTLEAMSWSRCVLGSPQAFTGLSRDLRGFAFVQVPLDAALMADALYRLALDPARRTAVAAAGRAYVQRHHSQSAVDAIMKDVYDRVLASS